MANHREPQLRIRIGLCLAVLLTACSNFTGVIGTRVYGLTQRGPTQPACTAADSCVAPFAANFTVKQGTYTVTHFRSDSTGHFLVLLYPGIYSVLPDSGAPVLRPQPKNITVSPADSIFITLTFDTGIR